MKIKLCVSFYDFQFRTSLICYKNPNKHDQKIFVTWIYFSSNLSK